MNMGEQKFNILCPGCRKAWPISARMFGETMRCFDCGRAWKVAAPSQKPAGVAASNGAASGKNAVSTRSGASRVSAPPGAGAAARAPAARAGGDSTVPVQRPQVSTPPAMAPRMPSPKVNVGGVSMGGGGRPTLHDDDNSSAGMSYAVPDVEPAHAPAPAPAFEEEPDGIPDFSAAAAAAPRKPAPTPSRSSSGRNAVSYTTSQKLAPVRPGAKSGGSMMPFAIAGGVGAVVLLALVLFIMNRGGKDDPSKNLAKAAPTAPKPPDDGSTGVGLGDPKPQIGLFDDPPVRGGNTGGPAAIDPPVVIRPEPKRVDPPEPTPAETELNRIGETFGRLTQALGEATPRNPRKLIRECNAFLEELKRSRLPKAAEFRTEFEKELGKFNRAITSGNPELAAAFQPEGVRKQLASLENADAAMTKQTKEDLMDVSEPVLVAVFYEELIVNPKPAVRAICADVIADRKDPSGAAALFVALQTDQDAGAKAGIHSALQRMTGRNIGAGDVAGWKNWFKSQP